MIQTVGELIEELSIYDEDTPIVLNVGRGASYNAIKYVEEEESYKSGMMYLEITGSMSNGYSASQVNSLIEESKVNNSDDILSELNNKLNEVKGKSLDDLRKKQEKEDKIEDIDYSAEAQELENKHRDVIRGIEEYLKMLRPFKNTPGYMNLDSTERKKFDAMTKQFSELVSPKNGD